MNKELFLKLCKLAETNPDDALRLIQKWCDFRWEAGRDHGLHLARCRPDEAEALYAEIAAESRKRNEEAGIFLEDLPTLEDVQRSKPGDRKHTGSNRGGPGPCDDFTCWCHKEPTQ